MKVLTPLLSLCRNSRITLNKMLVKVLKVFLLEIINKFLQIEKFESIFNEILLNFKITLFFQDFIVFYSCQLNIRK